MAEKKPTEKAKLRPDVNETAHRVMLEATRQAPKTPPPGERSEDEKVPEAVERGREGGQSGGKARAKKLSREEREAIARKAAAARWSRKESD